MAERNLHLPAASQRPAGASAPAEKLEALVRLSGGIAHDFNNILHVVKNATVLLRQTLRADAEVARLLDMLERNAERGTCLTGELLAFAARLPLTPVPVSVNRLIADMQHRLREALGRGKGLETVLGGSLWQVHADEAELETVILKLAENARDATATGGKVTIMTANALIDEAQAAQLGIEAGEYVSIAVHDTGTGMTAETLSKAFDPYFTTKEAGPMTGLGLSRVYGFVKQMRGHLTIDSAAGAGAAVTVYLPRLKQRAEAPQRSEPKLVQASSAAAPAARPRGLAGLRVLVVEDESLIGMLAEDLLEQLGCRMVGLVSSLRKAVELAKSAEVDLALLDVDIGGEPVYPVALALQARRVPFLFMSGYGALDEPWRAHPIVQKPFDVDQLRREIERALSADQ
jgi:nitrogen-specific signal transduction histidine kinase/CheY-like chemotaxis protein